MRAARPDAVVTRASLIGRLKNWKDQKSWEEFHQTYRPLIIGFALKQGLDAEAAEDIAQDTLLSVARSIAGFSYDPARSTFRNWLFTVARHRILDHIRRRPKEVELPARAAGDSTRTSTAARVPDPNGAGPEASEQEEANRALLDEALERLKAQVSTEHFQIFYLAALKQQSAGKVAEALGVSAAKVYVVRHRVAPRFKRIVALMQKELD